MATLCLSSTEGGVDLPHIRKFQLGVHLRTTADRMCSKSTCLWLDVESSMSKHPLSNLLFIRKGAFLKSACTNPITIYTIKTWHAVRKWEGGSQFTSIFTPICDNPDFPPGVMDNNFQTWVNKGISTLHKLLGGSTMMSFSQLKRKYDIQQQDFFRYLPVRNITKDTTIRECQNISHIERQLFSQKSGRSISIFYNILKGYTANTHFLKDSWEKELNVKKTDEGWYDVWNNAKTLSVCNRVRAMQLRPLHRAHISPSQRHKFNPNSSPLCPKCKIETGSLTHCLWHCRKVRQFWRVIGQETNKILSTNRNNDSSVTA